MVPVVWAYVLKDYQKQRLVSFMDPTADPLGSGYQLQQSQITVSSGGLLGRGLTNGMVGENLPVGATDFVFARVGEELGFLGGMVVLVLFALLIWRILLVGWRSGETFTLALSGGLAAMMLFQMVVNVGHGPGGHAHHRHPAAVRDARRRLAHQRSARPGHPRDAGHEALKVDLMRAPRPRRPLCVSGAQAREPAQPRRSRASSSRR